MDLFELSGRDEDHPAYQRLQLSNTLRLHTFVGSLLTAALAVERPMVSQPIIRALNFHAIAGLHHTAGTYRRHEVVVGTYMPPPHHRIDPLMDDFVNLANLQWRNTDPVRLAAFALWNLNNIHLGTLL